MIVLRELRYLLFGTKAGERKVGIEEPNAPGRRSADVTVAADEEAYGYRNPKVIPAISPIDRAEDIEKSGHSDSTWRVRSSLGIHRSICQRSCTSDGTPRVSRLIYR